ncbi:Hypothetical predicted protein, partial [Pelobates cultripes]
PIENTSGLISRPAQSAHHRSSPRTWPAPPPQRHLTAKLQGEDTKRLEESGCNKLFSAGGLTAATQQNPDRHDLRNQLGSH